MSIEQIFELTKQINEIQEQLKTELGASSISIRTPSGVLLLFNRNKGFFIRDGKTELGLGELPTPQRLLFIPAILEFIEKLREDQQNLLKHLPILTLTLSKANETLANNQLRFTPTKEV